MEVLQNRKKQQVDSVPVSHDTRLAKTRRREHSAKGPREHQEPPEFWDRLSEIPLVSRALKEFNRRTHTRLCFPPPETSGVQNVTPTSELLELARNGGPDLSDLRGYIPPIYTMNSSQGQAIRFSDPTSTKSTAITKTKATTSVYHLGFELHLTDHAIHPCWASQEPDLEEIEAALSVRRPSLSQFSDSAFKTFRTADWQARDEDEVKDNVMPAITGKTDHLSARNTPFNNLEPLTDGTISDAKPDLYYGAYPGQLSISARNSISRYILPSTMLDKPMTPNFFVEIKGPRGALAVGTRQACYDGAIGARCMHSLQNYAIDDSNQTYDGHAYSFSSTYMGGTLKIYAHHATAPTTSGGRPEYHMTHVGGYYLTGTRKGFVEGVTAFRNIRDLAKRYRDNFIDAANSKCRESLAVHQETLAITAENHLNQSTASLSPLQQQSVSAVDQALFLNDLSESERLHEHVTGQQDDDQRDHSSNAVTETLPSLITSHTSSHQSSHDTHNGRERAKRPIDSLSSSSASPPSKRCDLGISEMD
ncbi:hypothetical protein HD806DRAFT_513731 [Xylariaceae sp. AK1471]|nr:hypothetical protein HD806DRAFT_513731 [Xylariaceae sp. AK1471]